ncbi:MAG: HIT domain-containing protein [Candidatus Pacearchaeota archaeon]
MLTDEQVAAVKSQLIGHIDKSFPDERKSYAKEQIEHMTQRELEDFLKNNNLVTGQDSKCIFCSIVFGDIPSYKLDENSDSISVLEINPVSKGHSLIIPKKHVSEETEVPKEAEKLAKKISKKIKSKLKPKRVDLISTNTFGHHVINILPIYTDETIHSKRMAAKKEELEEVEKLLKNSAKVVSKKAKSSSPKPKKSLIKKVEKAVENFEKKLWLPQRIP